MIFKRWLIRRNWIIWLGDFILVLTSIMVLTGCTSTETNTKLGTATVSETGSQKTKITNVSAKKAYSLIKEKMDDPDFVIIDVRTPDEFNDGHLEGAINIDYNSDTFKDTVSELDRAGEYLVYCRSGNRSSGAVKVMEEMEFTMIYHMNGGIIDWSAEGLPFAR